MAPTAKEEKTAETTRKRKVGGVSNPGGGGNVGNNAAKVTKGINSLHQELTQMEEQEAFHRSTEGDAKLFASTCADMRAILKKIMEAKKAGKAVTEVNELKIQVALLFLTLKKLNRLDKLRMRRSRDLTQAAKQRVDSFHLQLQNLRYEVMHLEKEVTKCHQFRSKDEDINLIPVDEFYLQAPEKIAKMEETMEDEHAQRKARLEWEMEQRKTLAEEEKKMEDLRDKVEKEIREKQEKLSNLKPQLQNILETTKPVQLYLNMPLDDERSQLNDSRYLPRPLFVLYSQVRAFNEASDEFLSVRINGDVDEAKIWSSSEKSAENFDSENENEDDNEKLENEDEDTGAKKKRTTRGSNGNSSSSSSNHKKSAAAGPSKSEELILKLFRVHPLSVELIVKQEQQQQQQQHPNEVVITFSHLTNLKIVLAKVQLNLNKEAKTLAGEKEVLQASSLLAHLMGIKDSGNESPNPSTLFRIRKIGIKSIPHNILSDYGSPYLWAQSLAGLDFPPVTTEDPIEVRPSEEVCQLQVEDIIKAIRDRLESRLALQRQVSHLEKAKLISVDLTIPERFVNAFPSRISSRIRTWMSVDYEQYRTLDVTKHLAQVVDKDDYIYRLQINREPALLIALIAIKPDYPKTQPIFCLNLHWNGEYNIHNSENIRALEREVNLSFQEAFKEDKRDAAEVLSLQIQRLMACLDVMLEAWDSMTDGKPDFQREKPFLQAVRGRNRSLPLVYLPKLQVFSQR